MFGSGLLLLNVEKLAQKNKVDLSAIIYEKNKR
jgi:hypothetical protein